MRPARITFRDSASRHPGYRRRAADDFCKRFAQPHPPTCVWFPSPSY